MYLERATVCRTGYRNCISVDSFSPDSGDDLIWWSEMVDSIDTRNDSLPQFASSAIWPSIVYSRNRLLRNNPRIDDNLLKQVAPLAPRTIDQIEKYKTQSEMKLLLDELCRAFPNPKHMSHVQLILDFVAIMPLWHETLCNRHEELGALLAVVEKKLRKGGSRGGRRSNQKKSHP